MTRKSKESVVDLPTKFTPKFWQDADNRSFAVKQVKRRHKALLQNAGTYTYPKDVIAQRAAFVSVRLETMEADALDGEQFEAGVYTQMTNALLGMLKTLGIDEAVTKAGGLRAYLEERA